MTYLLCTYDVYFFEKVPMKIVEYMNLRTNLRTYILDNPNFGSKKKKR